MSCMTTTSETYVHDDSILYDNGVGADDWGYLSTSASYPGGAMSYSLTPVLNLTGVVVGSAGYTAASLYYKKEIDTTKYSALRVEVSMQFAGGYFGAWVGSTDGTDGFPNGHEGNWAPAQSASHDIFDIPLSSFLIDSTCPYLMFAVTGTGAGRNNSNYYLTIHKAQLV